jgi:hypothetical protein
MIAIPSVSRGPGTLCSVAAMDAMRVGAIAKPATNRATPIAGIDPTNVIGSITTARHTVPTRSRNDGVRRHRKVPVTSPAIRLPSAHSASRTPA